MTPQELKNSILQRAIQGKLVEQRSEEGNAEELYQQIQFEKQALIKAGKIKKAKSLPEIAEDEKPFDIPKSWKWCRIGKIFNLQAGKNITASDIFENATDDHPYLCFGGNGARGYVSTFNRDGYFALIGRQGALCGNINYANGKFYATEHAVVVEHFDLTDVLWAGYFLKALNLNQYATATAQPGLAVANINNVLIPLPPLAEQKRIVAKIEELLPLVDRYEAAWSRLEEFNKRFPGDMQKSLLQMAIQGKLVEQRPEEGTGEELYQQIQAEKQALIKAKKIKKDKPLSEITDDEKPFDIPESWKWVSVNEIAFVTKLAGFEYTKYMANAITSVGEVPIVRAKNIKPNCFIENTTEFISLGLSEQLYRCALDERCLLMTFIGAGIGEVAIFENYKRQHLAPNVAKIVPHIDINDYLLYYLMSFSGRQQVFQFMKQTAQPSLSMETIRRVLVPLPPLAEQKRIVAKLEELLPLCERLK